ERRERCCLGPRGAAEQDRQCADKREKVLEQHCRGLVCPVPVLEDEGDRLPPGEPLEKQACGAKDLKADALALDMTQRRHQLLWELERQERTQVRKDLVPLAGAEKLTYKPLEFRPRLGVVVADDPGQLAQRVDEGRVGDWLAERDCPALQPEQTLLAGARTRLCKEPRLADAGITAQEQEIATAREQQLQAALDCRAFADTAHERRVGFAPCAVGRALAEAGPGCDAPLLALQPQRLERLVPELPPRSRAGARPSGRLAGAGAPWQPGPRP